VSLLILYSITVFARGIKDGMPLSMKHDRKLTFRKPGAGRLALAADTHRWETSRYNGATQPISVPQTGKRQSSILAA